MNLAFEKKRCVSVVAALFVVQIIVAETSMAKEIDVLMLLPLEGQKSLTEDQALLYARTKSFEGGAEEGPLQACEDLIKDSTVPYDVYRWAYLSRITYYMYTFREEQALQVGHQWLREHPDDPLNVNVYNTLINICATRGHPDFKPTVKDLEAAAEPVFRLFPAHDLNVVHAHKAYAFGLYQFGIRNNDADLYVRALHQLQEADAILQQMLTMPALREDFDVSESEINSRRVGIAASIKSVSAALESMRAQKERRMQHETEKAVDNAWQELLNKGE